MLVGDPQQNICFTTAPFLTTRLAAGDLESAGHYPAARAK